MDTFDNRRLNWTALAELVLAVLITQMDACAPCSGPCSCRSKWSLALVPAVALFFLWELGKLIARREAAQVSPSGVAAAD